jgi:hypothetical protein
MSLLNRGIQTIRAATNDVQEAHLLPRENRLITAETMPFSWAHVHFVCKYSMTDALFCRKIMTGGWL